VFDLLQTFRQLHSFSPDKVALELYPAPYVANHWPVELPLVIRDQVINEEKKVQTIKDLLQRNVVPKLQAQLMSLPKRQKTDVIMKSPQVTVFGCMQGVR
jgi:hypothetical protein